MGREVRVGVEPRLTKPEISYALRYATPRPIFRRFELNLFGSSLKGGINFELGQSGGGSEVDVA